VDAELRRGHSVSVLTVGDERQITFAREPLLGAASNRVASIVCAQFLQINGKWLNNGFWLLIKEDFGDDKGR
jgi:hypothetical protein